MILYYIHDPMCSWCWGFESCKQALFEKLPADITVKYLLGGLASDTNEVMPDAMQQMLQQTWKNIEQRIPGKKFNFDFWTSNNPIRSTYPACRAVIAARKQNRSHEMIHTIQQAYYQRAMNPSHNDVLINLADELDMNVVAFRKDLVSTETQQQLEAEIFQAHDLNVDSFPALVLDFNRSHRRIPVDYINPTPMFDLINNLTES